jgi:diaminopimelate epimerase
MPNEMFYKCQSLGNDFVLLDWLEEDQNESIELLKSNDWSDFVCHLCSRNFGVGADGVLVIKKHVNDGVEGLVFNADGSYGETSLNGLRCITNYLIQQKNYSANFTIFMGNKSMHCSKRENEVSIEVGDIIYKNEKKLCVAKNKFTGHVVDVGNPHLVIFSYVDPAWLARNGQAISEHKDFPNRINVEFVWENPACFSKQKSYCMLVYERGVGMTLSCGSGAAAVAAILRKLDKVTTNEIFSIEMSGGELKTRVDEQNNIIQLASAEVVFSGNF